MKAVVLAGGFGTRLRPLSCTRPKHLFPVGNKPQLEWTLEKLGKSGVKEAILAVNYMADLYVSHFKKSKMNLKVTFSRDVPTTDRRSVYQRPLGTGGPIKNVEKLIGHKEPFFVLNGDVLTNINYAELMKKHRSKSKALATIALFKVDDPSRYGVAELTKDNRIVHFVEKPSPEKVPSNLINAGIYVLEPEIFEYIPSGKPASIEREVFPKLAEEGRLFGYDFDGVWIDIGEPEDYLEANRLWLETEIRKNRIAKDVIIEEEVEITAPSTIDTRTIIGAQSKLGPHVTVGEQVSIGRGVHLQNSIVFPGAVISDHTSVKNAIIGEAAIIGSWVKIESDCLVGDHATIFDNVTLTKGVTVCPWKEVRESVLRPKCLM